MIDHATENRVLHVQSAVEAAAKRAGRDPGDVTLIAVCKTVGREEVDRAYEAGIRHFGENRVQDAATKFITPLPDDAQLHMIGQLQTNKANVAARLFNVIQSVDRMSLIAELQKQGAKLDKRLAVLLQVNVAGEEQKAGCEPSEAPVLIDHIVACPHLDLRGLMTIAPLVDDAETVRPVFRGLRQLRDDLCSDRPGLDLPVLSMGMSNDFGIAIEEGATHVRVGRAIFRG